MLGEQLKLDGITRVLAAATAAHRPWKWHAEQALNALIDEGSEFTIQDLRARVPEDKQPHHPNSWGALLSSAAKAGRITPVGWRTNTIPSAHARVVRTWSAAQ